MQIVSLLLSAAAVIIGIIVHESAHALCAYTLGDATAHDRRRISINPLNHIDPFGTVLLPLIMMLAGGPVFAYAKPVPIYLGNLKHPRRDEALVAAAGPVSNLILACLFALMLGLLASPGTFNVLAPNAIYLLVQGALTGIGVNLSLAFFNLIPLPPLDGSKIIGPFLSKSAFAALRRAEMYSMPILIAVLYLLPTWLGIDIIDAYFDVTVYPIWNWLVHLALG